MSRPFLLSAVGSLGDLYPVLATARALQGRGYPVRLAVSPDHAEIARSRGVDAIALGPSRGEMAERLGLSRDQIAAQVFRNPSPILSRGTYPMLPDLTRDLLPHAREARLVGGTILAMAAPLAAEIAGRPYAEIVLQPMLLRSALDPPRVRGFAPPMRRRPGGSLARGWNRLWLRVIAAEFRRRHGAERNAARAALGLAPSRETPPFESAQAPVLRLGLWDAAFRPAPGDVAVELAGFPRLDPTRALPASLRDFLDEGPPPLVVSLGSAAQRLGGARFYQRAVAMARAQGMRVVLLSDDAATPSGPDVLTLEAAPHRLLFPSAAAVLHHGGIGTTAEALFAGRPQLVMPLGADQPDNAARISMLGVGRRVGRDLPPAALAAILTEEVRAAARDLSARLAPDGAERAADALIRAVSPRG